MKDDKAYMLAGIINQLIENHIEIYKWKSKGDAGKAKFADDLRKQTALQLINFLKD